MTPRTKPPDLFRFMSRVDTSNREGCWEWEHLGDGLRRVAALLQEPPHAGPDEAEEAARRWADESRTCGPQPEPPISEGGNLHSLAVQAINREKTEPPGERCRASYHDFKEPWCTCKPQEVEEAPK